MVVKSVGKLLYLSPRVLSVVFIIFLALFSLDVFDSTSGAGNITVGLFVHNVPSIVLLIITVIAWRRELVGAVAFFSGALLYVIFAAVRTWPEWSLTLLWSLTIAGPALVIAVLYYFNWYETNKAKPEEE